MNVIVDIYSVCFLKLQAMGSYPPANNHLPVVEHFPPEPTRLFHVYVSLLEVNPPFGVLFFLCGFVDGKFTIVPA